MSDNMPKKPVSGLNSESMVTPKSAIIPAHNTAVETLIRPVATGLLAVRGIKRS